MARRVDVKVKLDSNVDKEIKKDSKALNEATKDVVEFGNKGSKSIRKASKQAEKSVKSFSGLGKAVLGIGTAIAGGLLIRKISQLTIAQAELEDETIKTSRAIGIEVEALTSLRRSAELGGASITELDTGVRKLSKNIFDAVKGTGEAVDVFKSLNIEIQNTDGTLRSTEDVLLDVSDAFAKLEDGTAKNAQAQLLFGRAGSKLINTLNQGSDAIKRQREEAEKLGLLFSKESAENAEQFNDALADLSRTVQGSFRSVVNDLLPKLTPLIKDATQAIAENRDDIKEYASIVFEAFKNTLPIMQSFGRELVKITSYWSSFITQVSDSKRLEEVSRTAERFVFLNNEIKEFQKLIDSGLSSPAVEATLKQYQSELQGVEEKLKSIREETQKSSGETTGGSAIDNNDLVNQTIEKDNENSRERERIAKAEFEKSLFLDTMKRQNEASTLKIRAKTEEFQLQKKLAQQEQALIIQTTSLAISSLREIFGENKAFAIADIVVNTARGIQRSFADLPFPFNGIQAGLIGASGVAQVAKVSGAKFADGTEFVSGSGGSRDDKVPSLLSNGERVISANDNARLNGVSNEELVSGGGGDGSMMAVLGLLANMFTQEEIASRLSDTLEFGRERGVAV